MTEKWTEREFLDDLWHDMAGREYKLKKTGVPPLSELKKTEWCEEFEKGCRVRMVMGSLRYGLLKEKAYNKYDVVKEIKLRIRQYERDGNLEHLFDCSNMCMLQFMKGREKGQKIESVDDGRHAELINP